MGHAAVILRSRKEKMIEPGKEEEKPTVFKTKKMVGGQSTAPCACMSLEQAHRVAPDCPWGTVHALGINVYQCFLDIRDSPRES